MKKGKNFKIALLPFLICSSFLFSCGGQGSTSGQASTQPSSSVDPTPVISSSSSPVAPSSKTEESSSTPTPIEHTLSVSVSEIELEVGESSSFTVSVSPEKEDAEYEFAYDATIIELNKSTLEVKALKEGSTDIVVSLKDEPSATATISVTVNPKGILPTSISTDFARTVIGIDEEIQINVGFSPVTTTKKGLKFKSSNTSVARVSSDGLLKGLSEGTATITISSSDNPDVESISFDIEVSMDASKVAKDKALENLKLAANNEKSKMVGGSITLSIKNKNSTDVQTFKNDFESYADATYNNITDFSGNVYSEFHGIYDGKYYEVKTDSAGAQTVKIKTVSDEYSMSGSNIGEDEAEEQTKLPAILPYTYYSTFQYGVYDYLDEVILSSTIYKDGADCSVAYENNRLTITNYSGGIVSKTKNVVEIGFEDGCIVDASYSKEEYDADSLDDDFNPIDNAEPLSYEHFTADLSIGEKGNDKEKKINPADFYFSDFELNFYSSSDTDKVEPKQSFYRYDTIVYDIAEKSPEAATTDVDGILAKSTSDSSVISIAPNKMALNAVGEGTASVTFASGKVEKTYQFTVTIQDATGIEISLDETAIKCTESTNFQVSVTPYGAKNDIVVSLAEGDEAYATLTETATEGFYKLSGNPNMTEDSATVTIIAKSESNPELSASKSITIVKGMSAQDILNVLTSHTYKSEPDSSFYDIHMEATFTDTRDSYGYVGTFKAITKIGTVFDGGTIHYTIANGKLNIVNYIFDNGYIEEFRLYLETPDALTLGGSFVDASDEEDELSVTFKLKAVEA